jgi:hypothetical protein
MSAIATTSWGQKPVGSECGVDHVLPASKLERTSYEHDVPLGQGYEITHAVVPRPLIDANQLGRRPTAFHVRPPSWVAKAEVDPYSKPSLLFRNVSLRGTPASEPLEDGPTWTGFDQVRPLSEVRATE